MSRNPDVGENLWKGMETFAIPDPSKLKIPFGCKPPRKQSWMTVAVSPGSSFATLSEGGDTFNKSPDEEVVPPMELKFCPLDRPPESLIKTRWGVPGWALSVGYSLFGLGLGLGNLITPRHTGLVCVALSPLPVLCLLLQSLVSLECPESDRHSDHRPLRLLGSLGLALSACLLPSACALWTPHLAIPLGLGLSWSAVACMRHRDALAWTCLCGACLASVLALPVSQFLEPWWGLTVSLFFACVLCFRAGLGAGRVGFVIKF